MRVRTYYLIILLLSTLPFLAIFSTSDLPHTSDGAVQIPRMAAYYKALADGHVPPRWAGELNYGYGLPLFNFIYHTPFLISSLFIFLGLGLVPIFKLVLLASFLISGVGMFAFIHELLGDSRKAILVSVFYQFAPYRLVETLVRGSIGSIYAYAMLPLVLYGVTRLVKKPSGASFAVAAASTGLLVISHNSLSFIFFLIALLYAVLFAHGKKRLLLSLLALLYGLALSAFYWVPAIVEHKYTYGDLFMKDLFRTHFPPIQNFFIPNFFNSQALRTAEISVQFGLFHTVVLLLALYVLLRRITVPALMKKILVFSLVLFVGSLVFMQPVSLPLWERVSFLRQFQFPWRFLAVTSVALPLMSLSIFSFPKFKSQRVAVLLMVLVVGSTAYFWKPPQGYDKVNEADFWNYPLNTTYFGETDVIWSAGPATKYPKERIEVIAGEADVTNLIKKTNIHSFDVVAQSDAVLVDHTQFFPGWRVWIDGKQTPIQFQDPNWRGLIQFSIPQGTHRVSVTFGETKIRLLSDIISVTSTSALVIGLLFVTIRSHHGTT